MVGINIGGSICQGDNPTALGISIGYFDTVADLRAETETFISSVSVFIAGQISAVDGYGGMYTYDPASTAVDDGYTTIQQTNSTGAGRWILDPAYTTESVYASDTGALNTVAVGRMTRAPTAQNGSLIGARIAYTNTGASTLTDGISTWNIKQGGQLLSGGELVAGQAALFQIDNGIAHLVNSAGAVNVGTPTAATHAAQKAQVDALSGTVSDLPASYAALNGSATQNFDVKQAAAADNSASAASTSWIWTNIQALVASCISAVATAAGFAYSAGANGYLLFPDWLGGLMIQWGQGNLSGNGNYTENFTTGFPNGAFLVLANNTILNGTNSTMAAYAVSKTQFNLSYATTGGAASYGYIAIGN